jgi:hypothetical protein
MITRTERSHFRPRIGRSHALSRLWSHSTRLFAYWAVWWNADGISSSIAARNAEARSVTTSTGAPCARSAVAKNRRAAPVSRLGGDVHVDDLAVLVDRPVHVSPLPGDLHIRLVHEPTITNRTSAWPGRIREQWRESVHHRKIVT